MCRAHTNLKEKTGQYAGTRISNTSNVEGSLVQPIPATAVYVMGRVIIISGKHIHFHVPYIRGILFMMVSCYLACEIGGNANGKGMTSQWGNARYAYDFAITVSDLLPSVINFLQSLSATPS